MPDSDSATPIYPISTHLITPSLKMAKSIHLYRKSIILIDISKSIGPIEKIMPDSDSATPKTPEYQFSASWGKKLLKLCTHVRKKGGLGGV